MTTQVPQRDLLRTIRFIQGQASIKVIEDVQIAEQAGMELKVVQTGLNKLAEAGYLHLEKIDRLLGTGYLVSLTTAGKAALDG
jgi:hypothetical protein